LIDEAPARRPGNAKALGVPLVQIVSELVSEDARSLLFAEKSQGGKERHTSD
jgi:hypothetical protein